MNEEGNNEDRTDPYHTGGTNHTCQAQDKDKNQTGNNKEEGIIS